MQKFYIFIIFLCFSYNANAAVFGLELGKNTAEFTGFGGDIYNTEFDMGMTAFYNDSKDYMLTWDFTTPLEGSADNPWLFSLGIRLFGLLSERQQVELTPETKGLRESEAKQQFTFGAMANIEGGYRFLTTVPMTVLGGVGYSPNQINDGVVETMSTLNFGAEFLLSPSAILQVGYKRYRISYAKNKYHLGKTYKDIDDSLFVGVKLRL